MFRAASRMNERIDIIYIGTEYNIRNEYDENDK